MPKKLSSKPTASVWVQLYFVLSSLLGLVLTAIGIITMANYFLTQVLVTSQPNMHMPPTPVVLEKADWETIENLSEEQLQDLEEWQADYKRYQEEQENFDWDKRNREQSLVMAISLLVTGLPILLIHAPWVFRKSKE